MIKGVSKCGQNLDTTNSRQDTEELKGHLERKGCNLQKKGGGFSIGEIGRQTPVIRAGFRIQIYKFKNQHQRSSLFGYHQVIIIFIIINSAQFNL